MRDNMEDSAYKAKVFSAMKGAVTLEAKDADVRAEDIETGIEHSRFTLCLPGEQVSIQLPLAGIRNL